MAVPHLTCPGFVRVVASNRTAGPRARRLLVAALAIPSGLGCMSLWGQRAGLFGAEVGVVLVAIAAMVLLAGVMWWLAASLDSGDRHREQDAAALRDSEERLRAILDNANALIYLKDLEGGLLFINRRCEQVFHVTREQALGKRYDDFFPGEVADALRAHDLQILASGQPLEFEERAADDDGFHTYVSLKFPLVDSRGVTYGICGMSTDITVRKEMETALQESEARLTRALEAERQRTLQLEAANEALGSFTYSVSHDLRAPLRAINGYARMLVEDHLDRLDDDAQRVLGVICDNARQMGRLIDDLLTFSRLGRSEIEKTAVDMTALVHAVVDELQRLEPARAVTVTIGALPPVHADGSMIRQVLVNLLGNAWKFTRGRPEATIEVGARREAGETIYFVTDNGAGFEMQYAGKLFAIFQRLHRPDEFDGTGVGLAIVQRIVQRHGGRVWADGAVDRGATFSFALPSEEDTAPDGVRRPDRA